METGMVVSAISHYVHRRFIWLLLPSYIIAGFAPGPPAEPKAVVLPLLEALQQSIAELEPEPKTASHPKERSPRKRAKRTA